MENKLQSETAYLFSPNINVCFSVNIKHGFTVESIQMAIDIVVKRHPILLTTIRANNNGEWFYDSGGKVDVQFLNEKTTLTDWYAKNDCIPFQWDKGLIKIGVFVESDSTDIMILGHHILGDGLGYLNLIRDILSALDGKSFDKASVLPKENFVKDSGKAGLLMKLFAKSLNKKWGKTGKRFTYNEYTELFHGYRKELPPGLYLNNIESVDTIRATCQKARLTVNEIFAAAFVFALNRLGQKEVRLGCAASTRSEMYHDVSDAMGNFTTGIATVVASPEEVPARLREKLKKPKYRYQVIHLLSLLDPSLISSAPFAAYGDYDNIAAKKLATTLGEQRTNKSFGISNLGVQTPGDYSFGVSVQFICPAFPQNFLTVGLITIDNTAKFALRYSTSDLSENQAITLFDDAKEYLAKFIKDGKI
ncbi:MAG: hypothetical protein FWG63_09870 [Defluviitaleaceae bacterium]|nr:hypothetical protein [Defluviitaleaceae bacterium]